MEDQFYRMEEEYNRRRISTLRDRITIYILMFAVLFICYGFLKINPDVEAFYLETFKGRLLITLFFPDRSLWQSDVLTILVSGGGIGFLTLMVSQGVAMVRSAVAVKEEGIPEESS